MNSVQYGAFGPVQTYHQNVSPSWRRCAATCGSIRRRERTPDVGAADEPLFDLLRQHSPDLGCPLLQLREAVVHERVVFRIGFVEPVDKRFVQPALFAQVCLQFLQVRAASHLVLGRLFPVPEQFRLVPFVECAAA